MTTPIVIEITRNGNPLGDRNAPGQESSVTAPARRALLAPCVDYEFVQSQVGLPDYGARFWPRAPSCSRS